MATTSLIAKLRNALRRFGADARGNTVLTFSLALLPIMGLIGMAYDYTRASSLRTAMQAAVDITALKLAQNASTNAHLSDDANTYFLALFTNRAATNASATAVYSNTNGGTVVVTGTATYRPLFLGIYNMIQAKYNGGSVSNVTIGASSTANWSTARLRVALVLDNTGSMADGSPTSKISAMQTALTSTSTTTPGLLTQLRNAVSTDGDVYVSIIPFSKDVNLGGTNYSQSWIYWDDASHTDNASWDARNGACTDTSYNNRRSCTSAPAECSVQGVTTQAACIATGTCSISGITTQTACAAAGVCSIAGNTTQGACTSAGTCSIAGITDQTSCTSAGTCSISGQTNQSSCQAAGVCNNSIYTSQNACQGGGYCSISSHHTLNGCNTAHGVWHTPAIWTAGVWTSTPGTWTAGVWTSTPGTWTAAVWGQPTWTPNDHSTWNGCVMDRGTLAAPGNAAGNDETITAPTSNDDTTLYPAEQYSSCTVAVATGLSYDWSTMTTLVNNMTPSGNTNQAIGLQLGWMSLVGSGPFTAPAMDPNYTYQQYIILLTDGLNTQDRWYGTSSTCGRGNTLLSGHNLMCMDQREGQLCDNIKASGIKIFAIQVDTDSEATSALLQYCAGSTPRQGDANSFWLLTSPDQITATFSQIGQQISKLHIAR